MIRAGRALMYSKGYLPTVRRSHKTIVEFTQMILGGEYKGLTGRFNRMRRRRHDFIYDSINHMTYQEVKISLKAAKNLIDRIIKQVKHENPQKDLF